MTKADILNLNQALNQLGNLTGVKFAYGVSRNIAILKPELEALQKAIDPTDEYKKFDEERLEIVKKYAKKDEKGEFIIKDNNYEMADQAGFDKEFEEFKKKDGNKELFDARKKQLDEYNEMLKTESDVKLFKILLSEVPPTINVRQMHGISKIISEEVPTPYPVK